MKLIPKSRPPQNEGMSQRRSNWVAGGGVPDAHRFIAADGDDPASIRTELRVVNLVFVPQRRREWPSRLRVPDDGREIFAGRDNAFRIRTESDADDTIAMLDRKS